MAKVSVIVPVYNIEKYIDDCILSIVRQTLDDIEIIAVDDGSTDNSLEILKSWEKKDKRIKVIHKENGGVTSARYEGVMAATSEYIGFVDGDDYISCDMYENLYKEAVRNDVDAVYCESYYTKNVDKISVIRQDIETGFYSGEKFNSLLENMFDYKNNLNGGLLMAIYNNLYKREKLIPILETIPREIKFGEDMVCVYAFMTVCDKIFIVNAPYYYYNRREDSAFSKTYDDYLIQMNKIWLYLKKYAENSRKRESLLKQFKLYVVHTTLKFKLFSDKALSFYLFPYEKIEKGSDIILYGAGEVGISYFKQIQENKYCNIVLWSDSRFNKISSDKYFIESPDKIKETEYDYIVISVLAKGHFDSIKKDLMTKYGVYENKIITVSPRMLINLMDI